MKNSVKITLVTRWRVIYSQKMQKNLSIFLTGRVCVYPLKGCGPGEMDCILRTSVSSSELYSTGETEGTKLMFVKLVWRQADEFRATLVL